jgi:hypothetical protein
MNPVEYLIYAAAHAIKDSLDPRSAPEKLLDAVCTITYVGYLIEEGVCKGLKCWSGGEQFARD